MLNLVKGEVRNLKKPDGSNISKIRVGLSWDVAEIGQTVDLDVCVVHKESKKLAFYWERHTITWVELSEDNRTWEGDWDDEFVKLDAHITEDGEYIIFVNIYDAATKWQSFRHVNNAKVTVYNDETNTALIEYKLSEIGGDHTWIVVCSIKDFEDNYEFTAKWDFVSWNVEEIRNSLV